MERPRATGSGERSTRRPTSLATATRPPMAAAELGDDREAEPGAHGAVGAVAIPQVEPLENARSRSLAARPGPSSITSSRPRGRDDSHRATAQAVPGSAFSTRFESACSVASGSAMAPAFCLDPRRRDRRRRPQGLQARSARPPRARSLRGREGLRGGRKVRRRSRARSRRSRIRRSSRFSSRSITPAGALGVDDAVPRDPRRGRGSPSAASSARG